MLPLCTTDEMRALDGHAISTLGIPSTSLMETAGRGAAEAITIALGESSHGARVVILCGSGNNGGDGLVIARVLFSHGCDVQVLLMTSLGSLSSDASLNLEIAQRMNIPIECTADSTTLSAWEETVAQADVVVDALFGTGVSRPLSGHFPQACRMISDCGGMRVAVDIPSGLDASTGQIWGCAAKVDLTVCLGALKWGLVLQSGPEHAGAVEVHDIGIPRTSEKAVKVAGHIPEDFDVAQRLPARPLDGHKGAFGHVLIFAGSPGFSGAAILAARGALRTGAGLVTVATDPLTRAALPNALPEAMTTLVRGDTRDSPLNLDSCEDVLGRAKSLVIGPGLGQSAALTESLLELLNKSHLPAVVDADALHLISSHSAKIS